MNYSTWLKVTSEGQLFSRYQVISIRSEVTGSWYGLRFFLRPVHIQITSIKPLFQMGNEKSFIRKLVRRVELQIVSIWL